MVEVVKDNSKTHSVICDKCGSELSYKEYDTLHFSKIEEYHGKIHSRLIEYIKCPVCKQNIVVSEFTL